MGNTIDPELFRSNSSPMVASSSQKSRWIYRTRKGELFLRGPIPLWWLEAASRLSGCALKVGVRLWHLAGIYGSQEVKCNQSRMTVMGVSRDAARRGLAALEGAGLVRVSRAEGRAPLVFIIVGGQIEVNGNGKESSMKGEPRS